MKNKEPKLNVALLRKVKAKILEAPDAFDMGTYASQNWEAPCGTVACIAGWAVILDAGITKPQWTTKGWTHKIKGVSVQPLGYFRKGMEVLGLTGKQASAMFSGDWSLFEGVKKPWRIYRYKTTEAKKAAEFIDTIIRTKGKMKPERPRKDEDVYGEDGY